MSRTVNREAISGERLTILEVLDSVIKYSEPYLKQKNIINIYSRHTICHTNTPDTIKLICIRFFVFIETIVTLCIRNLLFP